MRVAEADLCSTSALVLSEMDRQIRAATAARGFGE
jgi:hypothetical protein